MVLGKSVRWLKAIMVGLVGICVLILGLLWALSPAASRFVLNDLLEAKAVQLTPESTIRFNPFLSRLSIHDLTVVSQKRKPFTLEELEVRYSLTRLLFNEAHISRIYVRGLHLEAELNEQGLVVAGVDLSAEEPANTATLEELAEEAGSIAEEAPSSAGEPPKKRMIFTAPQVVFEDLSFLIEHLGQPHTITFDKIAIDRSIYKDEIASSELTAKGSVNGAPLSIAMNVEYGAGIELGVELALEALDVAKLQYLMPPDIENLQAFVSLQSKLNLSQRGEQLALDNAALALNVENFYVESQGVAASFEQHAFTTEAKVMVPSGQPMPNVKASFDTSLDSLLVRNASTQDTLLAFERLDLTDALLDIQQDLLSLAAGELTLSHIIASKVQAHSAEQAANEKPALAHIEQLSLSDISVFPSSLSLNTLAFGGGNIAVLLDEQGVLATLVDVDSLLAGSENTDGNASEELSGEALAEEPAEETSSGESPDDAANESPAFAIKINEIKLVDPIAIQLVDESHVPNLNQQLFISTIALNNIDNRDLDQWLDFKFGVDDGEYFKFDAEGKAQPFKELVNANINANIKEFSLPKVSPYLAKYLDFEFKAGQLDTDLTAAIVDSQIDAKADLLLRAPDFSAAQSPVDETNIIGQAAIPLNVALGMLKDGDGNIKLKVPLDGSVDDPNFGMEYLMALVIKKAAMSQAKSYLMNTFVPYASVVSIGMAAGSYALKVRFEDLPYDPGQVEVGLGQSEFTAQLIALMKDKEDLSVKVCPVVTLADINAAGGTLTEPQLEQLNTLAAQRASAFKTAIVQGGIESSRLLICSPKIDRAEGAITHLDFSV